MKTISCVLILLATASVAIAQQRWHYPPAPRADVVDNYFGRAVADPYRPLEDLDAPASTAWVDAENAVTFAYLGGIAMRDSIRARLTALWNYPRVGVPSREAGQLWFRKNSGLQKQSVLYRAAGFGAAAVPALDANTHHQLFYHALGGAADRLVFERLDDSTAGVFAGVSDDGRWLFINSGSGTDNNRLWMASLKDPAHPDLAAPPAPVVTPEDAVNNPLGVVGDTLFLYTNWQAPRGRIVAAMVGDSDRTHWRTVVAEGPDVMNETVLVGNRLVVTYLVDVQSRIRLYDLAGTPRGEVTLPDVGTVAGLSGRNDGSDVFFAFSSYLRPARVYRYGLRAGRLEPFRPARTPFDATPYETRATFYQSKDGTRVPIFITARKGLARDGSHPTLLYAYGGFHIR